MVDQSSRRKNYALRSVIVRTNNQKESNIASRERYSAVVKSVKNGKWYHEQADQLHEIDFDSLDGSSIELLIYERDQQPRSEIGLHVAWPRVQYIFKFWHNTINDYNNVNQYHMQEKS